MARQCNDWLTSYIEYTRNTEPSLMFRKWCGIHCLTCMMGRRSWTQWDKVIWPNMFIVLVGPAGKSRKGTAIGPARVIIDDAMEQLPEHLQIERCSDSITNERLIQKLEEVGKPTGPNYPGSPDCSQLNILSEELTVLTGYDNKQFLSVLTDLYDCRDPWTYETKNSGTNYVPAVWLNLLGGTTPELLKVTLPPEAIGGGLTSRMMLIYAPDRGKVVPIPLKTEAEKRIQEQLTADLVDIAHNIRGEFLISPDWVEEYIKWYPNRVKNPTLLDPKFEKYLGREATHLIKLCMVVSASRDNERILDAEIFHRAVTLLEEAEEWMPFVFLGHGRVDFAQILPSLVAYIDRHDTMTFRQLLGAFGHELIKTELEHALSMLEAKGWIRLTTNDGVRTVVNLKKQAAGTAPTGPPSSTKPLVSLVPRQSGPSQPCPTAAPAGHPPAESVG